MSIELQKMMTQRASQSKNPKEYIEICESIFFLMDNDEEKFIKEMEWDDDE